MSDVRSARFFPGTEAADSIDIRQRLDTAAPPIQGLTILELLIGVWLFIPLERAWSSLAGFRRLFVPEDLSWRSW